MPIDISHLVAFLIGALSGAAGEYLGTKYTDKRRKKEGKKEKADLMRKMQGLMPELISEMRKDLLLPGYQTVREFVLLPSERVPFNSGREKSFAYFEDTIDNLIGKVKILEREGLVFDITSGNVPIYRMTEDFVDLLKR